MKPIIKIENLKREFVMGDEIVHALRGIDLNINEGEFVTIMGTSGSGKSTLLNILGCLDKPTSGIYELDGVSVKDLTKNQLAEIRNTKIGFIFQSYNLLARTSALENVELPLLYNPNISSEERRERAIIALKQVGLENRMYHVPSQLSGGQQQRVALARAVINKPKILLLDEPLSNIDTELRNILRLELKEMIKEFNITALFITHDKEDAFFLSDRIAIMNGGDILQVGTCKELYNNPEDLYCANFLGKISQISENEYIRPENIKICSNGKIEAIIKDIIFYGSFYEVTVVVNNKDLLVYSADDSLKIGQNVKLHFEDRVLRF